MKFIFYLLSFCYIFCFSFQVKAESAGSEITYACTATPGIFEITLIVYRDCNGLDLCSGTCTSSCTQILKLERADPGFPPTILGTVSMTLQNVRDVDIKEYCPLSKNTCTNRGCTNAGFFGPSYERYEFKGMVNLGASSGLPSGCCNVRITGSFGSRGGHFSSINIVSDDCYNYAMINRCLSISPCNNSPIFKRDPILAINNKDYFLYNNAACDTEYDSLSYHFVPALNGLTSPATSTSYAAPFSYLNPLPWSSFISNPNFCDSINGDIRFHPPVISNDFIGVIVVEVRQWKKINGVQNLIGVIRRETPMIVRGDVTPHKHPVLITNPPQSITSPLEPKLNWNICEGEQLCFTVAARDSIPLIAQPSHDSTYLSWDSALVNLGATFTPDYDTTLRSVVGGGPVDDRYRFCWTPAVGMASTIPYYFTVGARNKTCPEPGRISRAFSIRVSAGPNLLITKFPSACNKVLIGFTNLAPNIPLYSTVWHIAKTKDDTSLSNGYFEIPATPSTKSVLFKEPGRYYIQLIAISNTTDSSLGCVQVFHDFIDAIGTSLRDSVIEEPVSCYGESNGILTLNGYNGTSPYLYRLNSEPYTSVKTFNHLQAGQYVTWVKDVNNCEVPDTIVMKEPAAIFVGKTPIPPLCRDSNNAKLHVRAIGGNPPYQYRLNQEPYQTDTFFLNLSPGKYSFRTLDEKGCAVADSITIPNSPPVKSVFITKKILCHNDSTGTITVSGLVGTSPFLYAFNGQPFKADSTFSNLPAGNYKIITRDDHQCSISDSIELQNPLPIGANYIIVQPRCFGENDGGLTVTPIHGKAPFRYKITNRPIQSSPNFNGVLSAKYLVTIIDSGNCIYNDSLVLPQPPQLSYTKSKTDLTCHNLNDGSIFFEASGGTPPYTAIFDSSHVSLPFLFNNIQPGKHSYQIKDHRNCTILGSDTFENPAPLIAGSITGDSTGLVDHSNTYTAQSQANVSYQWYASGGNIIAGANSSSITVKWTSAGKQTVQLVITKNATCSDSARMNITIGSVGLNEIAKDLGLKIFPNPTKNILNINLQQLPEHTQIQLYDIQGKLVLQQELKLTQQLNIETLAPGMYMLKIGAWSGQVIKE